ncbi:MAG: response regulator [Candidatus Pacebacteria bacterium]|nr:response regulator [Candidatus Paceibacterota bacterium]
MKKTILIIEDFAELLRLWKKLLSNKAFVLTAETLQQAEELFHKHKKEIDLIAVDGEVNGPVNNTVILVKKIAEEFPSSKMLAISAHPDNNKTLINAGCGHSVIKPDAWKKIAELLA